MRTFWDRVRHTVLFEAIALFLVAVIGSWILNRPVAEIGMLGVIMAVLAMSWNMLFNWLFDLWDRKYRNFAKRGLFLRAVHATLFEAGMLIAGLFIIAWWLKVSLWEALIMDISFALFFLIYAYLYNWAYDTIFPRPEVV
ncbi:MAG: PACE efflux transporter [Sneathiellales bacterium]|nr:PACE efflux transporter [Sneathiellales bacterium]